MLAGRMQKEEALEECAKISNAQSLRAEVCINAVAAAAGDQEAVERLKSEIEDETPEARSLLDKVDGRTLVEVLVPKYLRAQLALMLLATVEGRADAVRLHGLWGSARSKRRPLLAVYENCDNLNGEMRFTKTRLCRSLYAIASNVGRGRLT